MTSRRDKSYPPTGPSLPIGNGTVVPLLDENTECKRCGFEVDGGRDTCPRCQFSPREKGLRVALVFLLGVVVCMTLAMFVPSLGRWLVVLATLSFVMTIVVFAFSFVATPYRFASVFLRF